MRGGVGLSNGGRASWQGRQNDGWEAREDFVQGKGLALIGSLFYQSHGGSLETG